MFISPFFLTFLFDSIFLTTSWKLCFDFGWTFSTSRKLRGYCLTYNAFIKPNSILNWIQGNTETSQMKLIAKVQFSVHQTTLANAWFCQCLYRHSFLKLHFGIVVNTIHIIYAITQTISDSKINYNDRYLPYILM